MGVEVRPPDRTGSGRVQHIISQAGIAGLTMAQGCLPETVECGVRNALAGYMSTNARKQGVKLEDKPLGP